MWVKLRIHIYFLVKTGYSLELKWSDSFLFYHIIDIYLIILIWNFKMIKACSPGFKILLTSCSFPSSLQPLLQLASSKYICICVRFCISQCSEPSICFIIFVLSEHQKKLPGLNLCKCAPPPVIPPLLTRPNIEHSHCLLLINSYLFPPQYIYDILYQ